MAISPFVIWMLVGGLTGLLASLLLSHMPAGVLGSVVTGIVGAVLAGLAFGLLAVPISAGLFTSIGVAFVGSVLLLAASQKLLG